MVYLNKLFNQKYPALAWYFYKEGLYKSSVVEKEEGQYLLEVIGIHNSPFAIFREEAEDTESDDKKEK